MVPRRVGEVLARATIGVAAAARACFRAAASRGTSPLSVRADGARETNHRAVRTVSRAQACRSTVWARRDRDLVMSPSIGREPPRASGYDTARAAGKDSRTGLPKTRVQSRNYIVKSVFSAIQRDILVGSDSGLVRRQSRAPSPTRVVIHVGSRALRRRWALRSEFDHAPLRRGRRCRRATRSAREVRVEDSVPRLALVDIIGAVALRSKAFALRDRATAPARRCGSTVEARRPMWPRAMQ